MWQLSCTTMLLFDVLDIFSLFLFVVFITHSTAKKGTTLHHAPHLNTGLLLYYLQNTQLVPFLPQILAQIKNYYYLCTKFL